MNIYKRFFGHTRAAEAATVFTLENENAMVMEVCDFGATILSLSVPDRHGTLGNVMLGYANLKECEADPFFVGTVIGRYANRIADGRFVIDGEEFVLEQNNNGNCLHGGSVGFGKVMWHGVTEKTRAGPQITLTRRSPDGEGGFPGNLDCKVTYLLSNDNSLDISYEAVTDRSTPVNLTHHAYYNLSGIPGSDILDHSLWIDADEITENDDRQIPTGQLLHVGATEFDYRSSNLFSNQINLHSSLANGIDHNWVLRDGQGDRPMAMLAHQRSGRVMHVETTLPGMQIYTGQGLLGPDSRFPKFGGICLETQHFPDSPNHAAFPSTILRPGETFRSVTRYRFSCVESA